MENDRKLYANEIVKSQDHMGLSIFALVVSVLYNLIFFGFAIIPLIFAIIAVYYASKARKESNETNGTRVRKESNEVMGSTGSYNAIEENAQTASKKARTFGWISLGINIFFTLTLILTAVLIIVGLGNILSPFITLIKLLIK